MPKKFVKIDFSLELATSTHIAEFNVNVALQSTLKSHSNYIFVHRKIVPSGHVFIFMQLQACVLFQGIVSAPRQ